MRNIHEWFTINEEILPNCGIRSLCEVFAIALSNVSISAGRIVTQEITPHTTPFAITIPRSRPSVNVMKHIARKPATVVNELPTTEVTVLAIA